MNHEFINICKSPEEILVIYAYSFTAVRVNRHKKYTTDEMAQFTSWILYWCCDSKNIRHVLLRILYDSIYTAEIPKMGTCLWRPLLEWPICIWIISIVCSRLETTCNNRPTSFEKARHWYKLWNQDFSAPKWREKRVIACTELRNSVYLSNPKG